MLLGQNDIDTCSWKEGSSTSKARNKAKTKTNSKTHDSFISSKSLTKVSKYSIGPYIKYNNYSTSTVPLIGSKKSQSNSSSISNSDECKNNQCLPTLKLSVSSLLNHSPSIPVSSSDKSYCKNSAPNTSEEESSAASLIKVATQATPPDETGLPSKNQKSFLSHQQAQYSMYCFVLILCCRMKWILSNGKRT